MATEAKTGYGLTLDLGGSTVGEITDFSADMSKETIDASSADSPDRFREFISSMRDAGEITVECNLTDDGQDAADDAYRADTAQTFSATYAAGESDAWELSGNCHVTSLGIAKPYGDKRTMSLTLKVTGDVTLRRTDYTPA